MRLPTTLKFSKLWILKCDIFGLSLFLLPPTLATTVDTSKSLLENARQGPNSDAWFNLHRIYDPLIAGWVLRAGIETSEVNDVTQEVLAVVAQQLPSFEHNGRVGAFRNWLKLITVNRCRRYWDAKKKQLPTLDSRDGGSKLLAELEDQRSDASALWDREHDSFVFKKLIDLIRDEFDPQEFDVFVRTTLKEESAQTISDSSGLAVTRIYKIRYKVMKRLRQFAAGILEEIAPD